MHEIDGNGHIGVFLKGYGILAVPVPFFQWETGNFCRPARVRGGGSETVPVFPGFFPEKEDKKTSSNVRAERRWHLGCLIKYGI